MMARKPLAVAPPAGEMTIALPTLAVADRPMAMEAVPDGAPEPAAEVELEDGEESRPGGEWPW